MRRILTIILIASVTLTSYQCSPSTDKKVNVTSNVLRRDISREKHDVVNELRWLRDDINDRLDEVCIKLETAPDKTKKGLEEAKLALINQRAKVQKSLDEIDQTADASWDDTQQNARDTSNDVKAEFDKLSGRIEIALRGD